VDGTLARLWGSAGMRRQGGFATTTVYENFFFHETTRFHEYLFVYKTDAVANGYSLTEGITEKTYRELEGDDFRPGVLLGLINSESNDIVHGVIK
jgi:hypothetical protein